METTLSTKGQVVLPRAARQKLRLSPGTKLRCRVTDRAIILTPEAPLQSPPRLKRDAATGLMVTHAPGTRPQVTNAQVRAALADFP
jgi:AbrB family looped-hinge helix DNA binding protein